MKKTILLTILSRFASDHGEKIIKNLGQRGVSSLSKIAYQRGFLDRSYDLETLTKELKSMYQKGQFSQWEWSEVSSKLRDLWRKNSKL